MQLKKSHICQTRLTVPACCVVAILSLNAAPAFAWGAPAHVYRPNPFAHQTTTYGGGANTSHNRYTVAPDNGTTYWPKTECDINESKRESLNSGSAEQLSVARTQPVRVSGPAPQASSNGQVQAPQSESIPPIEPLIIQPLSSVPLVLTPMPEPELPAISVCITRLEDNLLTLHDQGIIGSLDLDDLSEELLAIKRNYNAMLSTGAGLKKQQELSVRHDLKSFADEIHRRSQH